MKRTLSFYRMEVKKDYDAIKTLNERVQLQFPAQYEELAAQVQNKTDRINNVMNARHKKKFRRDGLNPTSAATMKLQYTQKLDEELHGNIPVPEQNQVNNNEVRNQEYDMPTEDNEEINESINNAEEQNTPRNDPNERIEELLHNIEIPSREPILLTDEPQFQETAVKTLLSKGPSFVPTPSSADWNQLHLDYERFCNDIRKVILFANSETTQIQEDDAPRKLSNWKAPRSNIPEAEVFLKQIEKDLFADVRPKKIESNLTKDEKIALQKCKKLLNNPEAETVIPRTTSSPWSFVCKIKVTNSSSLTNIQTYQKLNNKYTNRRWNSSQKIQLNELYHVSKDGVIDGEIMETCRING